MLCAFLGDNFKGKSESLFHNLFPLELLVCSRSQLPTDYNLVTALQAILLRCNPLKGKGLGKAGENSAK